jgi:hypothetical protein
MLNNRRPRQSGAETLEFIIVVILLAVAIIPALYMFVPSLQRVVCDIVDSVSGTTSNCAAGIIFNDDFSQCPGKWGNLMGSLSCENGRKCSKLDQGIQTLADGTNGEDYTISVNAELKSGNGYGIFFRAHEDPPGKINGYSFQYDPGLGKFVMRKWVNGQESGPFAQVAPPAGYQWTGVPRDIKIEVKGNTFTVYIDGKKVLEGKDDTYKSGQAGLRTWYGGGNQSCFDDFKVTKP